MTTFRSEEGLVGLVALLVIPWIGWTLRRGLRDQRLPIGRTYVDRRSRPAVFNFLLFAYGAAALLMAVIASNLLLGLELWS
jgi:hypothetical protein